MDNIDVERKVFLAKLKYNPVFLIRHLKALSGVALRRLRGKKRFPRWLRDIKTLGESDCHTSYEMILKIPVRQMSVTRELYQEENNSNLINNLVDKEDYLAANRFNGLFGQPALPAAIQKWLADPPDKAYAAWETYSCCERVANLLTWLSFIPLNQRGMDELNAIFSLVSDSMYWIYHHLEYYGKRTNNHILNNARALILCGTVLGNQNAVKAGIRILERMLPVLVQPDGFLRERSSHYQLIVLTWLLDVYTFLPPSEAAFLKGTLTRMRDAASMLCDADGYLQACIGDISPDASPLATCKRLVICYPEFWPANTLHDTRDDWHIISNKKTKVILNCPAGRYPDTHPAHSHNDITSFVWLYDKQAILVDTGRARYTKEPIAILQKSALGHNLPLVNHFAPLCESLVIDGNWWPSPYADARLSLQRPAKHSIIITHDGFKRTTPVKEHRREIQLGESSITVIDNFAGKGAVTIDILWQLHPSFTHFNKKTSTLRNADLELSINVPPQIKKGWHSTEYGYARSNLVLITKWTVNLPFTSTIRFEVKKCVV